MRAWLTVSMVIAALCIAGCVPVERNGPLDPAEIGMMGVGKPNWPVIGVIGCGALVFIILAGMMMRTPEDHRREADERRREYERVQEAAKDRELDRLERLVEIQKKARDAGINESVITGQFGGGHVESAHQRRKEKE
jgi:hypothetical protein